MPNGKTPSPFMAWCCEAASVWTKRCFARFRTFDGLRKWVGLENIDLEVASDLGVSVHSSPEGNRDAVGEHTLGMLLAVLHKLRLGDQSIRARRWERQAHRGRELKSLTVGIMGYGHMGSAFAERLAGMGCRVLAYDKHKEGWGESSCCRRPAPTC